MYSFRRSDAQSQIGKQNYIWPQNPKFDDPIVAVTSGLNFASKFGELSSDTVGEEECYNFDPDAVRSAKLWV